MELIRSGLVRRIHRNAIDRISHSRRRPHAMHVAKELAGIRLTFDWQRTVMNYLMNNASG